MIIDEHKVRGILSQLELLDGDSIVPLDSLAMVLLVMEIERELQRDLPLDLCRPENFLTVKGIAEVLGTLPAHAAHS